LIATSVGETGGMRPIAGPPDRFSQLRIATAID
jgi:hypothetical protein